MDAYSYYLVVSPRPGGHVTIACSRTLTRDELQAMVIKEIVAVDEQVSILGYAYDVRLSDDGTCLRSPYSTVA